MLKFKTGIVLEGSFTDRDIWKPMLDQAFEQSEFATLILQSSIISSFFSSNARLYKSLRLLISSNEFL